MFRANFQRTGVYQTTSVRQLKGLKWKFRQSPNVASAIPGTNRGLAVGDGVACVEAPGGNLYGLDDQTGQQLWTCQLGKGKKLFFPGIANGVLYIGSRQFDSPIRDDYLYAIDVKSGQHNWKLKIPFQSSSLSFASVFSYSSPAVVNEVVYIGGSDGNLYAIDTSSRELIWSFKTTKNMALTSPAVDKEILCVCSNDGYLYAIDLNARQLRWKFEIGALSNFYSSCPAIANEVVYISSSDNTFSALNLQDGRSLWTFNATSNLPLYSPAITEHIVCIGSSENLLYSLNVETGQPLWTFKLEDMQHCSEPIIAEETVYIGSQGFLLALDLETGEQLWQFQTPSLDQWILDPQMWVYGLANQLVKAFTGNTHNLEKFSEPVIDNGVVYVSCSNGYFYALY